ncbi:ABC transporter permease [Mucilaginibacter sp. FT3.2]|uniref:ABC transporter permease n=1 Tax=Mucilaginibacter sp. FT3.2 TaxID=2723090 RepID=UPI00161B4FA5|nr:ABC transporter permease [Mucilaginibacter sp. FT3.2]MBB6232655.1 ABC-2 type transport system permease protein [Mucilaginibacter sp. FT3.2]
MFKLWASIVKDVRILLRDRVGISLMFIMPVILVIVVTLIQNSTFQLMNKNKLTVVVCNKDTGKLSKQLVTTINKIGMFKVVQVDGSQNAQQIADGMHTNDAMLAITIPPDFTSKIETKAKASSNKALKSFGLQADSAKEEKLTGATPLTLYYNPSIPESIRFSVNGALTSALQIVESRETLRTLYYAINEKEMPQQLENEMLNGKAQINQVPVSKDGSIKAPNATQHNVPAWTIFAMFFIIMSLSGSVVREKVSGSFIRLKTLPTNFAVGLLSKQITYLCVTLFQALVIFSLGLWFFPFINLPALNLPSNIFGLILITVAVGYCAVSYAICVGVFAHTQEQANGFGAVSIVILSAIGGLMVPVFAMPGALKTISTLSPLHWCIQAYYGLFLEGAGLKDVVISILPLIGITFAFQGLTFIGLKRKKLI